jgi:hypothetical protein
MYMFYYRTKITVQQNSRLCLHFDFETFYIKLFNIKHFLESHRTQRKKKLLVTMVIYTKNDFLNVDYIQCNIQRIQER